MSLLFRSFCSYHTHIRRFQTKKSSHTTMPEGFEPFLTVKRKDDMLPTVMLRVTFRVRRVNGWQLKALPILGIPFFAGMPGFVSKVYGVDKSRKTFMGQYEWRSAKDAQNYIDSGAGRFMRRNAFLHTIQYEIEDKEPAV